MPQLLLALALLQRRVCGLRARMELYCEIVLGARSAVGEGRDMVHMHRAVRQMQAPVSSKGFLEMLTALLRLR